MNAQLAFNLEAALRDVDEQRALDRAGSPAVHKSGIAPAGPRPPSIDYLKVRVRAVLEAHAEGDQPYALRQALVDLAAVSTELAASLPRPLSPSARRAT